MRNLSLLAISLLFIGCWLVDKPPVEPPNPLPPTTTTTTVLPEPIPTATPTPTPIPTPEPDPNIRLKIDAMCAGNTNCGTRKESFGVYSYSCASNSCNIWMSSTYFLGNEHNVIHHDNPLYPGPIESWKQDWKNLCDDDKCNLDCNDCWDINDACHNLTCFRANFKYDGVFTACRGTICGKIRLYAR